MQGVGAYCCVPMQGVGGVPMQGVCAYCCVPMQGVWWYRSIKYGSSNVLIQTTQLFAFFLNKSKNIPVKRELSALLSSQYLPVHCPHTKSHYSGTLIYILMIRREGPGGVVRGG